MQSTDQDCQTQPGHMGLFATCPKFPATPPGHMARAQMQSNRHQGTVQSPNGVLGIRWWNITWVLFEILGKSTTQIGSHILKSSHQ